MEPVLLPFTHAVALPVSRAAIADASDCDAVAVTSARALTHAPPELIAALRDKRMFAVGDATADVAAGHASDVLSANGDAEALAALMADALPPDQSLAYLCGRVRTAALEQMLVSSGRKHVLIETYDITEVSHLTEKIDALARFSAPNAILFHSGVSADLFVASADADDLWQLFEKTIFFVISDRVGSRFPDEVTDRVVAADSARDDAIVAAVRAYFEAD